MSRFFDELEERLRAAAAHQAEAGPPRRRWGRRHRRLLAVAVIALCTAAVPAFGAVTDLWRPDVRPLPLTRTTTTTTHAARTTTPARTTTTHARSAFSCAGTPTSTVDVGPPVGPAFTSAFGVLARPRTPADRIDPRSVRPIGLLGVDLDGVRAIGSGAVPAFVLSARGLGRRWPERCLRGLDAQQRQAVIPPPRRERIVCLIVGGGTCGPLADVRAHGTFLSSGTVRGRASVSGLVPDGVRAVRVTYGSSTRTFPVSENFFSFDVALDAPQTRPDRVVWELDDGSTRDVTR